jgi:AraC-like DNA-binding protein
MNQVLIGKILLIGAFQAFFLAALLIKKKEKALHDFFMGAWLIFLGLYVSVYTLSHAGFFLQNPWLINLYISFLLLNGPFLYWYVKSLIHKDFKPIREIFLHLTPFLLFNLYLIIFFSSHDILKNTEGMNASLKIDLPYTYLIFLFLIVISVPYYILWSVRLLRNHRKNITNTFSALENKNLIWLRNLTVILGITWIMLVAIFFTHHVLLLFSDDFCINGLFLTLSVFIIFVGYFGIYQPAIFTSRLPEPSIDILTENIPYSGSPLKVEDIQKYLSSLSDYMDTNKPYLNNELTLYQLAEEVKILPHTLSRIINEYHHQNFFDYINQYRVQEFKAAVADPKYKDYSLLGIAFECGFNSKSAFNRMFKKSTGLTPSQFKEANL